MSTLVNVLSFDLDRHFIITSRGKNFRTMYTYEESYDYMSYGWKKLKQRIQRKYGYFDYICFPRAQRDGYVHLHVIVNKFIPWSFLDVVRLEVGLGYTSIQKNKSVSDYLHQDFFKDHEYYIPEGKKRYYSSRSIVMNQYKRSEWWNDENIFFKGKMNLDEIYDLINKKFGYPLPFEEYVNRFIELQKT